MAFIDDTEYFDFLRDKRVAIVGPAKSIEGTRQGGLIDSYDVVVRIKSTHVPPELQDDLGTKADVLYTDDHNTNDILPGDVVTSEGDKQTISSTALHRQNPLSFKYICSVYPKEEWFFNRFAPSLQFFSTNNKVRIMNPEPYFTIKKETNRPNAGFCAIIDLLTTPLEELYVTGLDFYRSLYRGCYLNSKWERQTVRRMTIETDGIDPRTGKGETHDPDAQFKYFKYNMYLKDKRIKVDKYLHEVLNNPIYEKLENIP
jgi:hypothetical protein